ncbi:protein of unknown function [Ralstonia solanacearum CMR15]|nr:protein of unknown function [Ralstonia solanacearum CMR15]
MHAEHPRARPVRRSAQAPVPMKHHSARLAAPVPIDDAGAHLRPEPGDDRQYGAAPPPAAVAQALATRARGLPRSFIHAL